VVNDANYLSCFMHNKPYGKLFCFVVLFLGLLGPHVRILFMVQSLQLYLWYFLLGLYHFKMIHSFFYFNSVILKKLYWSTTLPYKLIFYSFLIKQNKKINKTSFKNAKGNVAYSYNVYYSWWNSINHLTLSKLLDI
jgi:hypothetical protein